MKSNSLKDWIFRATEKLRSLSENPRLEAELLMAYVLKVNRVYLYTHPDRCLLRSEQNRFQGFLMRRLSGEPMAYITGKKSFWSFELQVNASTLIPRPETELLVEAVLACLPADVELSVADIGTGSGAIAIALALERRLWQVVATDISEQALEVARFNAKALQCHQIRFHLGVWCLALPKIQQGYSAIISNPPYIALGDTRVEDQVCRFEPHSALFSGQDGLEAIRLISVQARHYLSRNGWLFLEHGVDQAKAVVAILKQNHYTQISTMFDLSGKSRVTMGRNLHEA